MNNSGQPLYVQYGCAYCAPEEWINYDSSPTILVERIPLAGRLLKKNPRNFPGNVRYGSITKGLLASPASCQGIYASHVLEHLTYEEARSALKNTFTMLRPKGIFRVVVPDLYEIAKKYVETESGTTSTDFMLHSGLGQRNTPKGFIQFMSWMFGRSAHRWMWDYHSLSSELTDLGFKNIRRCAFGDCKDEMFKFVEEEDRYKGAVAIECVRP